MTPPESAPSNDVPPYPTSTDGTEDTQATVEFTPVNGARNQGAAVSSFSVRLVPKTSLAGSRITGCEA